MQNLAAVMTDLNTIEIRDVGVGQLGPNDAMVRIETVGVCGSDAAYFTAGRIGDWIVDGPFILGHESAGVVTAVGEQVSAVQPGDRVAIEPGTPCRNCDQCRAGRYHLCPDLAFLATPPFDGSLQQQLVIDHRCLFPMPDAMSFEQGALLEPLSVGIWACRRAGLQPGEDVLVSGAGPVGVLAAQVARALGARRVLITDLNQARLDLAAGFGLETAQPADSHDPEFDVLLECSGAPGALEAGLWRLRPGGRATVVGIPKKPAAIPFAELTPRELSIFVIHRYNNTWPAAMALVASGRVQTDGLVTGEFPLAETATALLQARTNPDSMKSVIYPQR